MIWECYHVLVENNKGNKPNATHIKVIYRVKMSKDVACIAIVHQKKKMEVTATGGDSTTTQLERCSIHLSAQRPYHHTIPDDPNTMVLTGPLTYLDTLIIPLKPRSHHSGARCVFWRTLWYYGIGVHTKESHHISLDTVTS